MQGIIRTVQRDYKAQLKYDSVVFRCKSLRKRTAPLYCIVYNTIQQSYINIYIVIYLLSIDDDQFPFNSHYSSKYCIISQYISCRYQYISINIFHEDLEHFSWHPHLNHVSDYSQITPAARINYLSNSAMMQLKIIILYIATMCSLSCFPSNNYLMNNTCTYSSTNEIYDTTVVAIIH